MVIKLPYGESFQTLEISGGTDVEILRSGAGRADNHITYTGDNRGMPSADCEDRIVLDALAAPINSRGLAALALGVRNAVVICSDHTRPVPSRKIIPHILAELRAENPGINVELLIATGMHRAPTVAELERKFGPEILKDEHIVIHDSKDAASMRRIGRLPSGSELIINKIAAGADLLVAEGFIEPHFFAGFSGGRKAVLPGICSYETVLGNHRAEFIGHPAARAGVLNGNPIHRDMTEAARLAKLAFIVNVVIDGEKRVVGAFAGEPETAHAAGCAFLSGKCRVIPSRPADIVVTTNGGAPLDLNIYQAVKCMTAAETAAAPGAVIIALAECGDGAGGDSFYQIMNGRQSPASLLNEIRTVPAGGTREDQWQAQILSRILVKHEVILVCRPEAAETARHMKLLTARGADEAFEMAKQIILSKTEHPRRQNPAVTVIPDGVSVIVGTQ